MQTTVKIKYGPLFPSIKAQLKTQGFKYDSRMVSTFERIRKSINNLTIIGILNSTTSDKSFSKLHKMVTNHVQNFN
jgi:hypothetical protein